MQRHRHSGGTDIIFRIVQRIVFPAFSSIWLLFAGNVWAHNEPISNSVPHHIFIFDTSSGFAFQAMPALSAASKTDNMQIVKQYLDSLGYFLSTIDSVGDTVHIHPGKRCMVSAIVIHSLEPCTIDSIQHTIIPRLYDAGELQVLAQRIVYFFGRKGYPFAELSVALSSVQQDTVHKIPGVTVIYDVHVHGFYVWGPPLILGKLQTSRKIIALDMLMKKGDIFDVAAIAASKKKLLARQYIASVESGAVGIEHDVKPCADTVTGLADTFCAGTVRVPLSITDKSGMGFDGAIAFQAGNAGATALSGIVNLSLLNLFHRGESGLLTYKGEKGYQKVEASASIPYMLNVPLFVSSGFGLEILQNRYSYIHGEAEVLTEMFPGLSWGFSLNTHEITEYTDTIDTMSTSQRSSHYSGADFVVYQGGFIYKAGTKTEMVTVKVGSGLSYKNGSQRNRWHVDVNAAMHLPLSEHHALAGRIVAGTMLADPQDTLLTAERYRVGGYKSLRGYTDDQFSLAKLYYQQMEYLYYFSEYGSLFVFVDAGLGFDQYALVSMENATKMLGYGIGLRIPVKLGLATFEWGRNYTDTRSWGRIHVSIQSDLSLQMNR
jgi:outer membrane protein assembly factor BamA